jgi:WD40 repeat protein
VHFRTYIRPGLQHNKKSVWNGARRDYHQTHYGRSLECIYPLEGHRNSVYSVALSHDASCFASLWDDDTVEIWDPATGQCISTLEDHCHGVRFGHTMQAALRRYQIMAVKIWDLTIGQCIASLECYVVWPSHPSKFITKIQLSSNFPSLQVTTLCMSHSSLWWRLYVPFSLICIRNGSNLLNFSSTWLQRVAVNQFALTLTWRMGKWCILPHHPAF